jgi:hypothetical protein
MCLKFVPNKAIKTLLLAVGVTCFSAELQASSLYQCADGKFSDIPCAGGIKVDVPETNTMPAVAPLPALTEAENTSTEAPKPPAKESLVPLKCRDLSLKQRQDIQQNLRFQNIVPCMTESQAKQIIRNEQHTEILYPAGGGNLMKEWIFTPPTPRFPNRVLLENGYVVETQ